MNDKELRGLTDEEIASKLKDLDPLIRERDTKGGITEAGGKALAESLPYRREVERRKEAAHKAKLDQSLAEINEAQTKERERRSAMTRLFGRWQ